MGNWNINIQGVGAHHNENNDKDADKMASVFVKQLKDAGHKIEHASFFSSQSTDIAPKEE